MWSRSRENGPMRVRVKGHPRWRLIVGAWFGWGNRWPPPKKGWRAHPRWRLIVGAWFGWGNRWTKRWRAQKTRKETGWAWYLSFLITNWMYKDGLGCRRKRKNVMRDQRSHRDRNNVRRVGWHSAKKHRKASPARLGSTPFWGETTPDLRLILRTIYYCSNRNYC